VSFLYIFMKKRCIINEKQVLSVDFTTNILTVRENA